MSDEEVEAAIKEAERLQKDIEVIIKTGFNREALFRAFEAKKLFFDHLSVQPLVQLLTHENWSLRMFSASALVKLRNIETVVPLLQALNDEEWLVREYAVEALGVIGDRRAFEALIKALRKDKEANVRYAAAKALGRFGDEWALQALRKARRDKGVTSNRDEVKEAAIRAIIAIEQHTRQLQIDQLRKKKDAQ